MYGREPRVGKEVPGNQSGWMRSMDAFDDAVEEGRSINGSVRAETDSSIL
jgi:hypothetical protein